MGVPVKPMNEAFGRASRRCRAKPSMKSYWLRCASSAMTTMFSPVAEQRMDVALLVGHELLDRREDDAAGGDLQPAAQIVAALGLHRRLPQQLVAGGEGAEELVVEVVAVGEHDERRVRHRRAAAMSLPA